MRTLKDELIKWQAEIISKQCLENIYKNFMPMSGVIEKGTKFTVYDKIESTTTLFKN